ncbi:MAG: GUN4 domain-containing protein [Xenococcaceae cyanobacterium]
MKSFHWKTFLKKHPFFSRLSEQRIELLLKDEVSKQRDYPENTYIIREGEPGKSCFLIGEGAARVTVVNSEGNEMTIATLSEDEFFGEMTLLAQSCPQPRSASVIAIKNCTLLELEGQEFVKLIKENSALAFNVLLKMSERLRYLDRLRMTKATLRMSILLIAKTLLSRYKITQKLGSGGFGDTYLAIDMALPGHPPCIVKNLKPKDPNPAAFPIAKKLFEREAEFLYRLGKHDQIPTLYAHFCEGGEFYLVEEFVDGHELSKEITTGKQLSEGKTVKLLQEILEILALVHQHNLIHRDIKPQNIIRRKQDGKLVLIDFGAVKEISALTVNSQGQTSLTVGIGSPGYMPSEQASGKPKLASDVYAVGMIGIQALTRVTPDQLKEDPDTGEIIWRNLVQVNDRLADVLSKMVRDHFSLRYKNASEALNELISTVVSPKRTPPLSTFPSPTLSQMQQRSPSHNPTTQLSLKPVKLLPWAVLVGLAVAAITGIAVINKSPSTTSQPKISSPTDTPEPTFSSRPTPSPIPNPIPTNLTVIAAAPQGDKEPMYTRLERFLRAGEWWKADSQTSHLVEQVGEVGRDNSDFVDGLSKSEIENLSCSDLRTINSLWLKFSNGKFGFSVQKDIWIEVGGSSGEYDKDIYKKFGDRNGWRKEGTWLTYDELTFNTNAPRGHLPRGGKVGGGRWFRGECCREGDVWWWWYLFSRTKTCNL